MTSKTVHEILDLVLSTECNADRITISEAVNIFRAFKEKYNEAEKKEKSASDASRIDTERSETVSEERTNVQGEEKGTSPQAEAQGETVGLKRSICLSHRDIIYKVADTRKQVAFLEDEFGEWFEDKNYLWVGSEASYNFDCLPVEVKVYLRQEMKDARYMIYFDR